MKRLLYSLFILFLFLILTQPSYGQFWKRKKSNVLEKNDISTPKKRQESRSKNAVERKVKIKKKDSYIEKKSKNNQLRVKTSTKSKEAVVAVNDRPTLTKKKDKPIQKLKKTKTQSEKMSESEGSVKTSKLGDRFISSTDEKVTQKVTKKNVNKVKKDKEKLAEKIADSNSGLSIKKKSIRRQRKEKESEAKQVNHSPGPIKIKPEPYRKRPGTIYAEDKKGGSKYNLTSDKQGFTFKRISPEKKEKQIAQKSKKKGLYSGDISLRKSTKEMHPSSAYLDGKKTSPENREKLRKKEVRGSKGKNSGQPKVVTEKRKKPKYNTRESEIWYE